MPFERARTLLLLGHYSGGSGEEGVRVGEPAGRAGHLRAAACALWADRARAELAHAEMSARGRASSPRRLSNAVAELAASGTKNRDVATTLFISPKTVEANLARIYRKLGIKSRAELGRHMGKT